MTERWLKPRAASIVALAAGSLCGVVRSYGATAVGVQAAFEKAHASFHRTHGFFAAGFSLSFWIYLGIIGLAGLGWGAYAWALKWRANVLAQRDREVFEMVDQWTKNLQQEVVERRHAQKALVESQQLAMRQERLAAVGQLAAGVAHEFNNILTVIQGHAALLMDNPALDADSKQSLNHISSGVDRTAKLIRQMLAFSRKQVMQQQDLEVNEVIHDISEMLRPLVGENISVRVELGQKSLKIRGDASMIEQIVVNLAVNSRDAMQKGGGQLTIRTREVNLTTPGNQHQFERRAGRFVEISISDTGCGMDANTMNHLFEPFFSTKDVGKGVGLGLATVYGMVNQHQGWIEVESQPGQGATFTIYFPALETANSPAPPAEQKAAANGAHVKGGSETILVVEDEAAVREIASKVLQGHGYRVLEAGSGVEALQVWSKNHKLIDVLLTDMIMPEGMSGMELADRLLAENPRLRIIFSSGYSQEMLEQKHAPRSGTLFLPKPYHPSQLAKVVRNSLDSAPRG